MSADLVIEHDGDTWRVIGQGATRPGQRLCHQASTIERQTHTLQHHQTASKP